MQVSRHETSMPDSLCAAGCALSHCLLAAMIGALGGRLEGVKDW
jgi:hypothetical protein